MDKLRLIKGVVVLLTSLIVLGIAAVIIGLTSKDDKPSSAAAEAANKAGALTPYSATVTFATTSGVAETLIAEGKGSSIDGVVSCGDGICLVIKGGGLPARVVMLNAKGAVVRKIKLVEE